MSNTIAQSLLGIIAVDSNTIYTMESTHTKINLNDGKLEFSLGKFKNNFADLAKRHESRVLTLCGAICAMLSSLIYLKND